MKILKNISLGVISVCVVSGIVYGFSGWEGVENAVDGDSLTHTVWNSLVDGVVKKTGSVAETITGNKTFSGDTTLGNTTVNNKLNTPPITTSISAGTITYSGVNTYVNGEGNVDDNLDSISGGSAGDIIIVTMNGNGVITLRDDSIGGGNIALIRNSSRRLEYGTDSITLKYTGAYWTEISTNIENELQNLKATNGYTYLPNGIIMQWGYTAGSGIRTVNLPVTFPNGCLNMQVVSRSNQTGGSYIYQPRIRSCSTTQLSYWIDTDIGAYRQVIGY